MEFVMRPTGEIHAPFIDHQRDTPASLRTQPQRNRPSGSVVDVQSRQEDERFDLPLLVYD
jgi:hypothetical protein